MKDDVVLYKTKYWIIYLRYEQSYLGRCIILLKRKCSSLSNLKNEEWFDFHQNIVKKLESAYKKAFGATMFNWTCLMNNAYQSKNPKPYVHFHFRPRYNHVVKFAGKKFYDPNFGHHYDINRNIIVSKILLKKISKEINKFL